MISEGIKSVSEVGIMVTASGVLIGAFALMFKKLLSDNTNKEVMKEISELKEEVTALRKGYVSAEVLKDKLPYFIQRNRWKIQNTTFDIIRINNIAGTPDIVDKKIESLYIKEKNKMSEMLEGLCDNSTKYIILQAYSKKLDENKSVIHSAFEPLKKAHGKAEEEESKKNIEIEMEQFEDRAVTDLKDLF